MALQLDVEHNRGPPLPIAARRQMESCFLPFITPVTELVVLHLVTAQESQHSTALLSQAPYHPSADGHHPPVVLQGLRDSSCWFRDVTAHPLRVTSTQACQFRRTELPPSCAESTAVRVCWTREEKRSPPAATALGSSAAPELQSSPGGAAPLLPSSPCTSSPCRGLSRAQGCRGHKHGTSSSVDRRMSARIDS